MKVVRRCHEDFDGVDRAIHDQSAVRQHIGVGVVTAKRGFKQGFVAGG